MEWVIECSVCRRPFAAAGDEMPHPERDFIRVPTHEIPGIPGSRCMGCDQTGNFVASKDDYAPRRKVRALLKKHPEYAP